jgi:DNA-binding transcriptional LysR family regulator
VRQHLGRGAPLENASADVKPSSAPVGGTLRRRDTYRMSLTQTGRRLLADAQALLAHAEEADQRLREEQTMPSGHLRLFATIDLGQSIVTRLVSSFLQAHAKVTAELSVTNRPLHLIQEGCDAGILPGDITHESVIARPAGKLTLYLAASPALVKSRPAVKGPAGLKAWPWIGLSGRQFWSAKEIKLFCPQPRRADAPALAGADFRRRDEYAGSGANRPRRLPASGVLIREDLRSGRLVRVLPAC